MKSAPGLGAVQAGSRASSGSGFPTARDTASVLASVLPPPQAPSPSASLALNPMDASFQRTPVREGELENWQERKCLVILSSKPVKVVSSPDLVRLVFFPPGL